MNLSAGTFRGIGNQARLFEATMMYSSAPGKKGQGIQDVGAAERDRKAVRVVTPTSSC